MADEIVQDNVAAEAGSGETLGIDSNDGWDPSKMPSLEEILSMVDGMKDMSEEEREELKASLLGPKSRTAAALTYTDYMIVITMISIILFIFAFFGYKLYLSLTEKERKREEKLKAKQAKKKK